MKMIAPVLDRFSGGDGHQVFSEAAKISLMCNIGLTQFISCHSKRTSEPCKILCCS